MRSNPHTTDKLKKITAVLRGAKNLLIVLQNYPDPDAVASGMGIRRIANSLGVSCSIAHGGMIGRAENRALVEYLDLNLRRIDEMNLGQFDRVALVDTQPATGNNDWPERLEPDIVIDHHPIQRASRSVAFTDIRSRYGATATIVTEYLRASHIVPEPPLATALLYGIVSDTQDLGREARRPDFEAHLWLSERANLKMLADIRYSPLAPDYFNLLHHALENARRYGNALISSITTRHNPDMVGEVADLLVRREGIRYCLCIADHGDRFLLSMRSRNTDEDMGVLMRNVVKGLGGGGGHHTFAGAQILSAGKSDAQKKKMLATIRRRLLDELGLEGKRGARIVGGE